MAYEATKASGNVLQAYGAYRQGKAIFEQEMANAELARLQSADRAAQIEYEGKQYMGNKLAQAAAAGADIEGSFLTFMEQDARKIAEDAAFARRIGEMQAAAARRRGRDARTASLFEAAGNLQGSGG